MTVFLLNDDAKRKLVRNFPPNGLNLVITQHKSRLRVPFNRTQEQKDALRARAKQLAHLRALNLAPPPVKRGPHIHAAGGQTMGLSRVGAKPRKR